MNIITITCPECGGEGMAWDPDDESYGRCWTCMGTGSIDVPEDWQKLRREPETRDTCSVCHRQRICAYIPEPHCIECFEELVDPLDPIP